MDNEIPLDETAIVALYDIIERLDREIEKAERLLHAALMTADDTEGD